MGVFRTVLRDFTNYGGFFLPILVMQIVLLVFGPRPVSFFGIALLNVLLYGSLLMGLYASRIGRRAFVAMVLLAAVLFIVNVFLPKSWLPSIYPVSLPLDFLLMVVTIVAILVHVIRSERVTVEVIAGAVAVYFLAGMLWAFLFIQVEKNYPGAFAVSQAASEEGMTVYLKHLSNYLYYSFTTLTTLGFGDITPVHPIARGLSVLETFFGQIYLTVLVARLVGIQISQGQTVKAKAA